MIGSSRSSFEAARSSLAALPDVSGALGAELFSVADALAASNALRTSLADSGAPAQERRALAEGVLTGKVSADAVRVVADVAGRRWTSARDLVTAVDDLGTECYLVDAERSGSLDRVEDELFRTARIVGGEHDLRSALTDPGTPPQARRDLLLGLLRGRVHEITATLVDHVLRGPRGRQIEDALDELIRQSARRRERLLAVATVAAPVTQAQSERLAGALGRVYHRDVDLQVRVDPDVLGGVKVTVGDEVIDGTVLARLAGARRSMGV